MTDDTRLEILSVGASSQAVSALIETQVILQLMVQKCIVTPDEVKRMREVVKSQPHYKRLLDAVKTAENRITENYEDGKLLDKVLNSGGIDKANLTEEERERLNKLLNLED